MADREGHGDYGQPECHRDPEKTYPDVRKRGGKNGAAASAENQPKCTDELGGKLPGERHVRPPVFFGGFMSGPSLQVRAGGKNTRIAAPKLNLNDGNQY
jgi:hypothetical protein